MSRAEAAAAMDRLPWLPDEPAPRRASRRGVIRAALGTVLAAGVGGALWFGARGIEQQAPVATTPKPATVKLPSARTAAPIAPHVEPAQRVEVEPIVAPPLPVVEAPLPVRPPEKAIVTTREPVAPAPAAHESAKAVEPAPPQPWPVRQIEGAAGRLVRIGAFGSVHQAKRGWWAIVKINPALERLPALVVPVQSLRNGRVYYRLQMGTTSQAHSAVLCQRMRMIAEPCVVIGLPQ
jgi:hypothetical protein